ncbi:hypothetical protein HIM_04744 [Hirsutella minnesotensis 3608]|uniref:N-acetyltransferase domain-containing protein n=1 Tax=Hirsutella minnesotensis 3608 TaxID=1043627 RepID=A0A0F7ZPQ7_9HYPO|nr:hypothetical protein HIM_04744 [Hirsutella minnesotensis 3608]
MAPEDLKSRLEYERASASQITSHFQNNSQMWAAPLSTRDYLDVQRHLSVTEASTRRTAYWVLYDQANPETVIASCTTYMRDALINAGQGMRPVGAAIITDLFTLPEYRRQGMASMLLEKLRQTLDQSQPKIEFSLLYSDVRPEFFETLGWIPQPAPQVRIVLGRGGVDMPPETDDLMYIHHSDLIQLTKKDINMTKLRLSAMRDGKRHALVLPTHKLMRWHLARSMLLKKHMSKGKDGGKAGVSGAFTKSSDKGLEAWAWWTPDFRCRRLNVGRLVSTRLSGMEHHIKSVLGVALGEASRLGLREVVVWEPLEQTVNAANLLAQEMGAGVGAILEDRLDLVPCLRWHNGEKIAGGLVDGQFCGWS